MKSIWLGVGAALIAALLYLTAENRLLSAANASLKQDISFKESQVNLFTSRFLKVKEEEAVREEKMLAALASATKESQRNKDLAQAVMAFKPTGDSCRDVEGVVDLYIRGMAK